MQNPLKAVSIKNEIMMLSEYNSIFYSNHFALKPTKYYTDLQTNGINGTKIS